MDRVSLGNLQLDLETFKVSVGPEPVRLTYQEFEVLRLLVESRDKVVTFEALTAAMWAASGQKETRRLNVLVCRLRRKLLPSAPYSLETVRGRGYGWLAVSPGLAKRGPGAEGGRPLRRS